MSDSVQRLNKFLALEKGISRREADNLIGAGRVTVNGTAAVLGARIEPSDDVRLDESTITASTSLVYIVMNKPVGYVCSRKAQGDSPTIYELLTEKYHALKPVGRLDKESSGLLLLTNDGDFAFQMTHPKFHKQKTYQITLDKELAPLHQQMISDHGIELEDGNSKLILERRSDDNRLDWTVLMHEGRNRQIRRTFLALGYQVTALHRTIFGSYRLDGLASGSITSISV